MRVIKLLLLLFLLAGAASAQSPSSTAKSLTTANAPDVMAEPKGWREEVRNPMLEDDPLRVNQEQIELERARQQNQRDNAIRASMGMPQKAPPAPAPAPVDIDSRKTTVQYIYRAKFTNNGTKEIRKLVWEYVFFEPGTEKEVGRRHNETKVNIRAGQSRTLEARTAAPPTGTIDATQAAKKKRPQYSEQIVIQSIEYADGTTWQRAKD